MKNYNKSNEPSYIEYSGTNNLYEWTMSQKLQVNDFKWIKKRIIKELKNYDENGNIGYFLEVDIDYPKELFNLHKDLPFLPERKIIAVYLRYRRQEKICNSYQNFKTST